MNRRSLLKLLFAAPLAGSVAMLGTAPQAVMASAAIPNHKLYDLYISPEAMADIRAWSVIEKDTAKLIFNRGTV